MGNSGTLTKTYNFFPLKTRNGRMNLRIESETKRVWSTELKRGFVNDEDEDDNANGLKPTSDLCYMFGARMVDQLRFDQKWDFRRKDDSNSSSADDLNSNSIHEPVLKKHKPVFPPNNAIAETIRLQTEQNPETPNKEGQIKSRKAMRAGGGRRKKNAPEDVNEKTGTSKKTAGNNGTTRATDQEALLEGVQVFMESLIEDLNASREKLFERMTVEMHELEGDDASGQKETGRANNGRKKRVQRPKSEKISKSTQVQGHDNEHNMQVHARNCVKETVLVEEQSMHNENVEVQVTQNMVEAQHTGSEQDRFNLKCDIRAQNYYFGHLERLMRNSETGSGPSRFQAQKVQGGQITEFDTPTRKEEGKSLVSSSINKPSHQPSSSAQQNVFTLKQKRLVLGITAQSSNLGTAGRSSKAKKSTDPKTINKPPQNQTHLEVTSGSVPSSSENFKNRNSEPSVEPRFSSNLLVPGYSPWCSTFPSLQNEPAMTIHGSASFPSNHVQLRRGTQEVDSSVHQRNFPVNQSEKAIGSFTQLDLSNPNCFFQNNNYFSGFSAPFHQGLNSGFYRNDQVSLENLQRDNTSIMGLRMDGGALRFSGGSNSLSEQHSGIDITNLSEHRFNGRQIPYKVQNINNGSLFQK